MHNLYFCILKTLKVNYNSDPKIDNEKRRRFAFRRASFWSIFAFVVIAALVFNKDVKFWNVEVKSAHTADSAKIITNIRVQDSFKKDDHSTHFSVKGDYVNGNKTVYDFAGDTLHKKK